MAGSVEGPGQGLLQAGDNAFLDSRKLRPRASPSHISSHRAEVGR